MILGRSPPPPLHHGQMLEDLDKGEAPLSLVDVQSRRRVDDLLCCAWRTGIVGDFKLPVA